MKLPKLSLRWVAIGVLLAIAAVVVLVFRTSFTLSTYDCQADDEIPQDQRSLVEEVGLSLVQSMLAGDVDTAYSMMTTGAQKSVSLDQFKLFVRDARERELSDKAQVDHTYLVSGRDYIGRSSQTTCRLSARDDDRITLATSSIPEQAYLLIDAQSRNNGWTFVLWMMPDQDWRVEHVQLQMTATAGKSAADVWQLAREQRDRNHLFNATLLYFLAAGLADRGPNFELGILPEIKDEMSKLQVPRELQGQSPFTWQFGSAAFKITNVTVGGSDGKLYLDITQELPSWSDDGEADRQNRKLMTEFKRAYPEYKDAFALTVTARESGGPRGYRTGEDSQ